MLALWASALAPLQAGDVGDFDEQLPRGVAALPRVVMQRVTAMSVAEPLATAAQPAHARVAPLAPPPNADHAWSDTGCMSCHDGVEEMHPWQPLSCTDCHGGDGASLDKQLAHVSPEIGWPKDERVMHRDFELAYSRFKNPTDLRVLDQTCASCHPRESERVPRSMHGTTAGHLNDGLYENGVNPTREAVYGIFTERDERPDLPEHALDVLINLDRLLIPSEPETLGDHFADLPSKNCMQCHLWSPGLAVRGRLGHDGLYRSSGCAACHVSYAPDGLSFSRDPTIDKFEPGHARKHEFTRAPPTDTCVSCHVGDASIGNGFRGLAQLYPNMPAGPDVPNTTNALIAEQFFVQDPLLTPPDLHHAAGMHCIDCHTGRDVMGDGNLYGAMEHAVEIECVSCHGTIDAVSDLTSSRGRALTHLRRNGELVIMTSKVTGRAHRVKQVKHVVDPNHADYNAEAARAMTGDHASLECYACHSGWNTNFFGFHFDRNTQFRQLDLVSGNTTRGVVSTQERVFATLRQYVLGQNSEGMLAPYMVGFSSMGTVHGEDGEITIDQGLPETAAGLSGMTMIHHQTHTNQPQARSCVECHRSASTWGLGTGGDAGGSFALARQLIVAVGERGVETMLLDREAPGASVYLARLPLGGAIKVVLDSDIITGHAATAFVVIEGAGVALVDVRNPAFPSVRAFVAAGDAKDVLLAGDLLVVANGTHGLRLVDVADRDAPELLADVDTEDARGLAIDWPTVFVADGPGGLLMVDVGQPGAPRVSGQAPSSRAADAGNDATAVSVFFQYGRPQGPEERTAARRIAVVANGAYGASVLDVTEPLVVKRLSGLSERYGNSSGVFDVAVTSRFELGDTSGTRPTIERDVAYMLAINTLDQTEVLVMDVSTPERMRLLGRVRKIEGGPAAGFSVMKTFSPPTLSTSLMVAAEDGLHNVSATDSEEPNFQFSLPALAPLNDVAVEAFAFDRMIDESGRQLKDVSHEDARYLTPSEIERILTVPAEVLGLSRDGDRRRQLYADAYSRASHSGGLADRGRGVRTFTPEEERDRLERKSGGFAMNTLDPEARMVRQAIPTEFDSNRDTSLSSGELERLLFDVLDANHDGELDVLEWPRHPNPDAARLDRDGNGVVSRPEMSLDREAFERWDVDGDGRAEEREWPFETLQNPLPGLFYMDRKMLFAHLESVGFQRKRPELYEAIAGNARTKPRDIKPEDIDRLFRQAAEGVLVDVKQDPLLGAFLSRWDFDGDGDVDPNEFLAFDKIASRCDLNQDGQVDLRDKP